LSKWFSGTVEDKLKATNDKNKFLKTK